MLKLFISLHIWWNLNIWRGNLSGAEQLGGCLRTGYQPEEMGVKRDMEIDLGYILGYTSISRVFYFSGIDGGAPFSGGRGAAEKWHLPSSIPIVTGPTE
jgi:hypothetical protein